jgi:hypothetical protein
LAHEAKARGYSSVYALLEAEGHDKFAYQKKPELVLKKIIQIVVLVIFRFRFFFIMLT